jgi:hypothetical protein
MEPPRQLTLDEVKQLVRNPAAAANQVESLLTTLKAEDEELCAWTADALQAIEQVSDESLTLLAGYGMHQQARCAVWACKLLMKIQTPAEAQTVLCRALKEHSNLGVRQQAAAALASIASPNGETLAALEAAAKDEDPRLSRLAAQALEKNNAA